MDSFPLAPRSQDVKAGLEPHFVEDYQQVYQLALDYPQEPVAATA